MEYLLIVGFVAVMSTVPYAILRGRRRQYAICDSISYAVLAAIWVVGPLLGLGLEPSLAFAIFVGSKLAVFLVFLAAPELEQGWNANWAAVFAAAIYLLLVPHVLRWPIDGDEPYYLLVTESLVADQDFDLRNQYVSLERSATRRLDLRPQLSDPVGRQGEQYSRTEPFLSFMLIPGYLLFGLHGAVATIALFGALLLRSTMLLLKEEGVSDRAARICFAFLAFGPPAVFYATRIWPEAPAAFLLAESLRGFRLRRPARFTIAIVALSLLKLRFVLIAIVLLLLFVRRDRRRWRAAAIAVVLLALPLLVVFVITGQWLNVHEIWELHPQDAWKYPRGALGLLFDAQAGLLFQATFFFVGVIALLWWQDLPESARVGFAASALYLLLLFPRDEWHGGWSPPLRYLVVLMPVLCIAVASLVERLGEALLTVIAVATAALTIHGIAFPWRLFHIANGENVLGEWLSSRYHADFSRMLPSFIRLNGAAVIVSVIALICVALFFVLKRLRLRVAVAARASVALTLLLLAAGFHFAMTPGSVVHFEDSHVQHRGGELYPHEWTVARFLYRGGWNLRSGDEVRFRCEGGESRMVYYATAPAQLEVDGRTIIVPATSGRFRAADLTLSASGDHVIRCRSGEVILDRIEQR